MWIQGDDGVDLGIERFDAGEEGRDDFSTGGEVGVEGIVGGRDCGFDGVIRGGQGEIQGEIEKGERNMHGGESRLRYAQVSVRILDFVSIVLSFYRPQFQSSTV